MMMLMLIDAVYGGIRSELYPYLLSNGQYAECKRLSNPTR